LSCLLGFGGGSVEVFVKQIENTCRWISFGKMTGVVVAHDNSPWKVFWTKELPINGVVGIIEGSSECMLLHGQRRRIYDLGRPTSSLLVMVVVAIIVHDYLQNAFQFLHPLQFYP
jgi:hypothetical protein